MVLKGGPHLKKHQVVLHSNLVDISTTFKVKTYSQLRGVPTLGTILFEFTVLKEAFRNKLYVRRYLS